MDIDVTQHIEGLVRQEEALFARGTALSAADKSRLKEINVRLDQYYDLLRQRRAQREAGLDPAAAMLRDPATVENYQQ